LQKRYLPWPENNTKTPFDFDIAILLSKCVFFHSLDVLQSTRAGSSSILKRGSFEESYKICKKNLFYSSPFDKNNLTTFNHQVLQKYFVLSNIIAILWIFWHPGLCLAVHWTKFVTFCRQLNP